MNFGRENEVEIVNSGVRWHVLPDCAERIRKWLGDYFPALFEEQTHILKSDRGSRVAVAADLVIKESTARKGRSVLRFGLRRSGAYRAFRLGNELIESGINTPKPVAWATIRRFGLRRKEYLITEEIAGGCLLTEILTKADTDKIERQRIISLLGETLASFHLNGYSNRDMKDTNVIVTHDRGIELWVIDLDGVRGRMNVTRWRAARDFWPIVRSLGRFGWLNEDDKSVLLSAYNAMAPERLRFEKLPYSEMMKAET